MGGRGGRVAEGACDDIGCHVLCSEANGDDCVSGARTGRENDNTYEKGKDESWENGKDGPNTEKVGEGRDPRIGIVVPEIVYVRVPERGRDGGHDGSNSFTGGGVEQYCTSKQHKTKNQKQNK